MAEVQAKFHKDMNIGQVLSLHPRATEVIEKYFGQGCFTCPGIRMESIAFGAMMHGTDAEAIVRELNALE
ncbi:MAG: DUF1858 domain-containing protein [Chloroflexi bacterium]|nr:DUF1858 domain-containing protein [Chloroflexota bacterium]